MSDHRGDKRQLESYVRVRRQQRFEHVLVTLRTTSHPRSLQEAKLSNIPVAVSSRT